MSEGSEDAAILIATSYQALNRAMRTNDDKLITDCTVLVLFAGFYVESTLNHIFKSLELNIETFPFSERNSRGKHNLGMRDKLALFYNEFVEETKAVNWDQLRDKRIYENLELSFPGSSELVNFRNDISHGKINQSARSLVTAMELRQQAKNLVNNIYAITISKGYNVPRLITYRDAIGSLTGNQPEINVSIASSS